MNQKLKIKDFITIGIFMALILVVFSISGMALIALSPHFLFISMGISALVLGPVYLLFIAKVQKRNAVLILGLILVSLLILMFAGFWAMAFGYIGVILAELIARKSQFKDFKWIAISYSAFSFFGIGAGLIYYVMPATVLRVHKDIAMVKLVMPIINAQTLVIGFISIIILSLLGAFLGKKLLKKHFERAGIV